MVVLNLHRQSPVTILSFLKLLVSNRVGLTREATKVLPHNIK